MTQLQFRIEHTEDYNVLEELFIKSGIEVGNEPIVTEKLKCWKAVHDHGGVGTLIGGAILGKRGAYYVVDGIAVEPEYRKMKIGTIMLDKLVEYAKEIGIKKLWLMAKAPGFFKNYGFATVKREDAPNIFGCFNCDRYGKDCKPEPMVLDL
ncbi:MAG TPA: GNAT family N-acetyltransferase [Thermoanaerobacterales bacterium]|nr:GNAT family N-acetyltransferase [Thermoanaerobacterales bacterium]